DVEEDKLRYSLVPADYDPKRRNDTLLPWSEIVVRLAKINCRNRLLLLDQCYVGGVSEELEQYRYERVRGRNCSAEERKNIKKINILGLTSCQSEELSYEHPDWGHGAFTKVLLD